MIISINCRLTQFTEKGLEDDKRIVHRISIFYRTFNYLYTVRKAVKRTANDKIKVKRTDYR